MCSCFPGELDDKLLPTGKEAVRSEDFLFDEPEDLKQDDASKKASPHETSTSNDAQKEEEVRKTVARPGTTKRRMYYFKKVSLVLFIPNLSMCFFYKLKIPAFYFSQVSDALRNSLPLPGAPCYLYVFDMKLTCPIPEEQNTRGRKIHDPSNTQRRFGILTSRPIPPVSTLMFKSVFSYIK